MFYYSLKQLLRYKPWLTILSIFSTTATILGLVIPYFTARFIDTILIGKNVEHLRVFISLFIIIVLFEIISSYFSSIYSAKIQAEAAFRMNMEVIQHVQRLPLSFFQKKNSAYLAQRIDNDIQNIIAFTLGNIINIFSNILTLFAASALLFSISPVWLVLFFIASVVYGVIYYGFRKPLCKWSHRNREAQNLYFSHIVEQFTYIKTIKIHALYNDFLAVLEQSFLSLLDILISRAKLSFWFSSSGKIAQRLFVLFVFLVGGSSVIKGSLSLGNFVALNSYFSIALGSITFFLSLGQSYQDTNAAFLRVKELLDNPEEAEGEIILNDINCIRVENMGFIREGRPILEKITCEFKKGHIYSIVGENGTGKTTLLYLLIGLLKHTSGTITYNDIAIDKINTIAFRRNTVGFLEQEPTLLRTSLRYNMLAGSGNEKKMEHWMNKLEMADFVNARERNGFVIDDHHSVLSGGEKQKIALIRAFAKNAQLVILDEPASALDEHGTDILLNIINEIKDDKIVIITTHKTENKWIIGEVIKI